MLQAYSAYLAYFNAALKKYNAASSSGKPPIVFQQCNAQALCGPNYMANGSTVFPKQGPASCMQISGIDLANSVATASALKSLQVYIYIYMCVFVYYLINCAGLFELLFLYVSSKSIFNQLNIINKSEVICILIILVMFCTRRDLPLPSFTSGI